MSVTNFQRIKTVPDRFLISRSLFFGSRSVPRNALNTWPDRTPVTRDPRNTRLLGLTCSDWLIPTCYNERNKKENCPIWEHYARSYFSFWNMFFESKFTFERSQISIRVRIFIHFVMLKKPSHVTGWFWSSFKVFEKILVWNCDFFSHVKAVTWLASPTYQNGSKYLPSCNLILLGCSPFGPLKCSKAFDPLYFSPEIIITG